MYPYEGKYTHWRQSVLCDLEVLAISKLYTYVECRICGKQRLGIMGDDRQIKRYVDWDFSPGEEAIDVLEFI